MNHLETGKFGEDTFVKHLVKHSYTILDRNYSKKWGEIDIVAKKDGIIHFFEVKALKTHISEADQSNGYNPEENVHYWKKQRLAKTIESYLVEKAVSQETEWQVDVAAIFIDFKTNDVKIRVTENIDLI